jgi:LPS export ABC transporter protein LptC
VNALQRCVPFAVLAALAACGGDAASNTSAANAPSVSPTPFANGTPILVHSTRTGSKYVYVTEQRKNRKVYVLRADEQRAEYFGEGSARSEFTNPHVTFYDEKGRTLVADSPTGTAIEKDKSVIMSGGVHAHTQDGKQLTCDTLRYNDATQRLYGDGNVVITSPNGEELRGDHLDADLRLSELHVTGTPGAGP